MAQPQSIVNEETHWRKKKETSSGQPGWKLRLKFVPSNNEREGETVQTTRERRATPSRVFCHRLLFPFHSLSRRFSTVERQTKEEREREPFFATRVRSRSQHAHGPQTGPKAGFDVDDLKLLVGERERKAFLLYGLAMNCVDCIRTSVRFNI